MRSSHRVLVLALVLALPALPGRAEPITPAPSASDEAAATGSQPAAAAQPATAVPARAGEAEGIPADEADEAGVPPSGRVERSAVTSGIAEREPVDQLAEVPVGQGEVFFFTDLRDLEGRTVLHRWSFDDHVVAEVPLEVGGPRWRVWSSKTLQPDQLGRWSVSVVDAETGALLGEADFATVEGGPEPALAEPAPEAAPVPDALEAAPHRPEASPAPAAPAP